MYDEKRFLKDFNSSQIITKKRIPNGITDIMKGDLAWSMYINTSNAPLGCLVFGRRVQEADVAAYTAPQLPTNLIGILANKTIVNEPNFGVTNEYVSGSILETKNFNFTVNDAWLLAGVHKGLDFYPASPIVQSNIFHEKYGLTITGRELLGLVLFGYKVERGHGSIGSVYISSDGGKAARATLSLYRAIANKCNNITAAKHFFSTRGVTIPIA